MRPLKLEFEGINSFSEHTIIDFERLIKGGIFGIFGDTGSGKSTILDCINFALYGRVERSKEKTDIINYRCAAAKVEFTFDLFNRGKRRTYLVERTLKRKNGVHSASLYEDGVCIAQQAQEVERQISEIIGVKAEDFRKCIALPQGEFSRFVKSVPSERLALIERLFSLSKYGNDLRDKISEKIKEVDEEYANLSGALSAYEGVTEDIRSQYEGEAAQGRIKLGQLSAELGSAVAEYEKLKTLYERKEEAERLKSKIEELDLKKSSIDELRREISVLPACREAVAYLNAADAALAEEEQAKKQLAVLKEQISANDSMLAALTAELEMGGFERRIEELTKLTAKYQTCSGKPAKLKALDAELEEKRAAYKKAVELSAQIVDEINGYAKESSELERRMGETDSDKLEQIVNVEFKGAVLRSEYVASLQYFSELGTRLERFEDNSKLYSFIKKELKEQVNIYKQRVSDVKDFKMENVTKQLEALQAAIKEREAIGESLRSVNQKYNEARRKEEKNRSDIENLKKEGAEIRKRADEIKSELEEVFGKDCADYGAAEKSALEQLGKLKEEHRELLARIENCKKICAETGVAEGKINEAIRLSAQKRGENLSKSDYAVKKSGLGDISECIELARRFADVRNAEQTVKEFDASYAAATSRYSELMATEGLERATLQALESAKAARLALENQKNELSEELAVVGEKLANISAKLREKEELLKKFQGVRKNRDLIYQLRDLTKGNKFLEFIADEYLYDISSMASVTLLKLTDGRYYLTYKDNNFNIGDNFDCGNLRGVNTLSGGETFLVSLSLALALSQTICSRSLKSIEFFFLDEGFGTLDSALLDTVMSALEKLKSSSFTIGVISHVEELKHRIDNKIIVQKATESHGSTVQISC